MVGVPVSGGGKDKVPPTGQVSCCHVQQMQPKLSEKNHNNNNDDNNNSSSSRVRTRHICQCYWNSTDMSHNKHEASQK